jgi:predicted TIM-barrel fold metal-dependent hydrolase
MTTINPKSGITRRGFFERSAGLLAATGILAGVSEAKEALDSDKKLDVARTDQAPMTGKIALEEHFTLPDTAEADSGLGYALFTPELRLQMQDMGSGRIAEMDRGGVELSILSLPGPGIQAIPNISLAIATAQRSNDYLAERIAKYPKRLKGFAALPLQDPQAAAQELTRCVKELGFCGALVVGFSQIGLPNCTGGTGRTPI